MVEQIGDEDHAHGGIVSAHQPSPDAAELGASCEISGLVDAIGGKPADMLGRAAGLGEDSEHVGERLLELQDQLLAVKALLLVPTDLAGDEYDASGGNLDPVGVSNGRLPAFWK